MMTRNATRRLEDHDLRGQVDQHQAVVRQVARAGAEEEVDDAMAKERIRGGVVARGDGLDDHSVAKRRQRVSHPAGLRIPAFWPVHIPPPRTAARSWPGLD